MKSTQKTAAKRAEAFLDDLQSTQIPQNFWGPKCLMALKGPFLYV